MDFGTWISKGIPYANQNGETFLRKKYLGQAPAVSNENQRIVLTKESDIAFLSDCKAKLEAFIEDDTQIEFVFDKCNSYLRRVLYQLMEFDFPSYKVNKTATDQLQVLKLSDDARRELESKILEEGKKSFEELMGFRLVFLDMVAAKKPFIGHNCLFDFMFMMRWLDLPFKEGKMETLTDFKIKFNGLFPVVFDTKYIAESGLCGDDYASTALGDLYENIVAPVLAVKPFVRYAVGFDEIYSSGGQLHDAGWDAYCTGALFCYQLNLSSSLSYLIEKAGNKLFMMQSMFHMDIDPSQPNGFLKIKGTLLHIGNFSPDTKMDTILQVFVVGGYELTSLSMSWIDGTSTFMGINTLDTPEEVKTKITVPDGWVVKSYEEFSVPPIATDVVNENGNMENPLKRSFSAGI